MINKIQPLIQTIRDFHYYTPVSKCIANCRLVRFMPEDLRLFMGQFNNVRLFNQSNSFYIFPPIEEMFLLPEVYKAVNARYSDFVAFSNDGDGNWRACNEGGTVIDVFQEYVWQNIEFDTIADSFTEFLELALSSGNRSYWL